MNLAFAAFLVLFLTLLAAPIFIAHGEAVENAAQIPGARNLKEYIEGKPFNVGSQWVVLADDYYLEDKIGVRRIVGHVIKSPNNPLVSADQPWEDAINWPSVIYDKEAGIYRMWYQVWNAQAYYFRNEEYPSHSSGRAAAIAEANRKHWYAYFICYATSRDGKHWKKPLMDLYPYLSFPKTNIVFVGVNEAEQTHFWLNDDQSNPARRFLMTYTDGEGTNKGKLLGESLMLAYSADGIHWTTDEKVSPLLTHDIPDGSYQILFDKPRNRWVMYRRPDYHSAAGVRAGKFANVRPQRRYGISINNHLGPGWTYPTLILVPDEAVERRDIDTMDVFREGTDYIALLGEMDDSQDGVEEVHLALSHDGVHWSWFPYLPPLIPRGKKGSWDAGQVQPPMTIVKRGEFCYMYYTGVNVGQRVETGYESNIGMCRLHTGRWIGLAAGMDGGYVLTRDLVVSGNRLELNSHGINTPYMQPINGNSTGYIKIELLRRNNVTQKLQPIPGFTFAESDPLWGDSLNGVVTWEGKSDLSSLLGTAVYIRFHLVQSELWELRFVDK